MRIIPVTFIAILVLSMTTSSALMVHPQEPIPQAFAQSTEYSIRDLGDYVVFGFDEVEIEKEVTVITGSVGAQNKKSEVEIDEKVTFEDPNSAVVGDEVEIDKKALVQDVYYNKLKNKSIYLKKIFTFVNVFFTLIIVVFLLITNKQAFRKQIPILNA